MADYGAEGFDYGADAFTGGDSTPSDEGNVLTILPSFYDLSETGTDLTHLTLGQGQFFVYRLRGYDATLGRTVYWQSLSLITPLAAYTGPGVPSDVVVTSLRVEG